MITGVAIKQGGFVYSMPKPNRHHHVIEMMINQYRVEPPVKCEGQGFVDENGAFLTREEAAKHAVEIGQIEKCEYVEGCLFSEDLW